MKYGLKIEGGKTLDSKADKLSVACTMAVVMSKGKSGPVLVMVAENVAAGFSPVSKTELTDALKLGVSGGTISKTAMQRYLAQLAEMQKAA